MLCVLFCKECVQWLLVSAVSSSFVPSLFSRGPLPFDIHILVDIWALPGGRVLGREGRKKLMTRNKRSCIISRADQFNFTT